MHHRYLPYLLCLAVLAGACASDDPAAPPPPGPANEGYVPLAEGDTWIWRVTQTRTTTVISGGSSPPPEITTIDGEYSIVGTEDIAGATYSVQRRVFVDEKDASVTTYVRYRQDESGLYTANVPEIQPPAVETYALLMEEVSMIGAGERVQLRYPLQTDATWVVSAQETATCEGPEVLLLPAGRVSTWRIRIEHAVAGPDDYVRVWYSSCGMVRTETHQEILAMDPGTGQAVRLEIDVVGELVEFLPAGDDSCN